MKIPELLAPVGNFEHLKIAINSGASSVYLSGYDFSARKYASNFTLSEIKQAIEFAHLHNVKVYLAVNILIKESEIKEVLEYIAKLYNSGVDGIIVQDYGLIKVIKEYLPNLEIHSSTQLRIQTKEQINWAKEQGIKRIILPRELKISEMKKLSKYAHQKGMEVEIFVHGALCYAYSGHCLLSSYIGGRSGNRGTCGQACRLKYSLSIESEESNFLKKIDSYKPYLTSTKDLCLYKELEKIIELEIDCLKIEGRMRNNEYVKTTVNSYRQGLNKLKSKSQRNYFNEEDYENLHLVFNREFTTGHFLDNPNQIINPKKPSPSGLAIGYLKSYNEKSYEMEIQLNKNLKNIPKKGDGLLIEEDNHEYLNYYGFDISTYPNLKKETNTLIIKKVPQNKEFSVNPGNKSIVYLTKRKDIAGETKTVLNNKDGKFIKSTLTLNFKVNSEHQPILKAKVKLPNNKLIELKEIGQSWQLAKNKPISAETIEKNLRKTDELPLKIKNINITYKNNLFTPNSQLNRFRREFYQKLKEKIIDSYKPKKVKVHYKPLTGNKVIEESNNGITKEKNTIQRTNKEVNNLSIYINDLNVLKGLTKQYKRIYLEIPPSNLNNILKSKSKIIPPFNINHSVKFIEEAVKISNGKSYELVWKWPDICSQETLNGFIKTNAILAKENINLNIMTGIIGLKELLKNTYNLKIYGSSQLNIFNSQSMNNLNFDLYTLSAELTKDDIKDLMGKSNKNIEIIVHGNLEAMITRNPIVNKKQSKEIKKKMSNEVMNLYFETEQGDFYPIKGSLSEDESILLNSSELCLISEINSLKSMNINNYSIDCRWKNIDYVNNITDFYKKAISEKLSGNKLKEFENEIKTKYSPNITSLNFNRKLK